MTNSQNFQQRLLKAIFTTPREQVSSRSAENEEALRQTHKRGAITQEGIVFYETKLTLDLSQTLKRHMQNLIFNAIEIPNRMNIAANDEAYLDIINHLKHT